MREQISSAKVKEPMSHLNGGMMQRGGCSGLLSCHNVHHIFHCLSPICEALAASASINTCCISPFICLIIHFASASVRGTLWFYEKGNVDSQRKIAT